MNVYVDGRALDRPNWRGEQRYVHALLSALARLDRSHRWHVQLRVPPSDDRVEALLAEPNVVGHVHGGRVWPHVAVPLELRRTRSSVFFRMAGEDAPLRVPAGRPVVALVHDNGRHLFPVEYGIGRPDRVRRDARRALRRFQLVVTVSHAVQRELIEELGVAPEKIVVVPNAVGERGGAERRPAALRDDDFVLVVNPGGGNKNWRLALDGYARFADSRNGAGAPRLVLAGDLASEEPRVRAALRAHAGLESRVDTLGYVGDDELRWLYRHARVLVAPSRYEGFGVPLLEAMAAGLPVVASAIPAHREVADDAALFVSPDEPKALADTLQRVLADDGLRRGLVARGHARLDAYSWERSAAALLPRLVEVGAR
jgi:glycosyltransferase involved in cell wall biosynthesis